MKNIKKLALIAILGVGTFGQTMQADPGTQNRIRKVIEIHYAELKDIKNKEDLKKFLTPLIKDLKEAVKNAPNTAEYKKLKDALNAMNVDQIVSIMQNLKTILNSVDSDIRTTVVNAIPVAFRALLMI